MINMKDEKNLILVDEQDKECGKMGKLQVHKLGLLHRAFSIFIFNSKGQLLLQQRADEKYHSGGLWTNTCCSHPEFGEELNDAVSKRLFEEMGLVSKTEFAFSFIYNAAFDNGLIEHEFDHVFIGISDELPKPDRSEVQNWKYMDIPAIQKDIIENPAIYTVWFKMCFADVVSNEKFKALSNS